MTLKKFLINLFYIFLISILIFNLCLIFQEKMHPEKIPSIFGIKFLTMNEKNMQPKLKQGDVLLICSVKPNKINKKDIIVYEQGFELVVNRVTDKINENENIQFKTKGDNNNAENSGTINADLIEGKVIGKIPLLGKFFAKEIITIIVFIIGYFYIPKKKNKTNTTKNRYK